MKDIPKYGSKEWGLYQYEQAKKAKRGHNYEYWNEVKHSKMLKSGWSLFKFEDKFDKYAISAEYKAAEIVKKLRSEENFARIIAGYSQNIQRIKMFSIIYKTKSIGKKT